MTEISYEIAVNVKAPGGWRPFGLFKLGCEKQQAIATFESLAGKPSEHEAPLRVELFEHGPGESLLLAWKGCTLDELAENARVIARDAFKYFSLE